VVTGSSGLADHTGSTFFTATAVVFFLGLVGAWATGAVRTVNGVRTGALLR
jgi:hypothetical protein